MKTTEVADCSLRSTSFLVFSLVTRFEEVSTEQGGPYTVGDTVSVRQRSGTASPSCRIRRFRCARHSRTENAHMGTVVLQNHRTRAPGELPTIADSPSSDGILTLPRRCLLQALAERRTVIDSMIHLRTSVILSEALAPARVSPSTHQARSSQAASRMYGTPGTQG
jgi:hypothetical protein